MFEWLKNLLFEEEEVTIEESEIEEIDFANNRKDIADIIAQPSASPKRVVEEYVPLEVKSEPVNTSFGIEVEPLVKEKEKEKKPMVRMLPPREPSENKTVEMNVISPMYGGTQETKPTKKNTSIDTPPKRRSDALGTVISPMYGQNELATHEQEAIKRIEEEKPAVVVSDDWNEEEVSLDEILLNEEETEDCVQFSLFGDESEKLQIQEDKEETQE